MGKFFDSAPTEKKVNPGYEDVSVRMPMRSRLNKGTANQVESKHGNDLRNGRQLRANQLVCQPQNDNEWECGVKIHTTVGEGSNKRIVEDVEYEVQHIDNIRLKKENIIIKDGTVHT